jgi:starch phosphorylase
MKAALNGVPSLSVIDGWWVEGHIEGLIGWSIGEPGDRPTSSREDAAAHSEKLEGSVVPMFYRQPDRFVDVMRHAHRIERVLFSHPANVAGIFVQGVQLWHVMTQEPYGG